MEYKNDRETAVAEFEKFCEANEIGCDESEMSSEDLESFKPLKENIVRACMQGRLVVNGRDLEYTISEFSDSAGEKIVIKRPKGYAFMAMDGYKDQQSVHKLQSFISALTGKESKYFSKLDKKDWMFFSGVATLFLVE